MSRIPPPPPGFVLEGSAPSRTALPPPPHGFVLETGEEELEGGAYPLAGPLLPTIVGIGTGAAKGVGATATGLGRAFHAIPGFSEGVDRMLGQTGTSEAALAEAQRVTEPANTAEAVARGAEQVGEFFLLPGPAKVRGAMRALEAGKAGLAAAGLAKVQGATGGEAVVAGVTGGLPVAEGVAAAGRWAGRQAAPFVRAAIKPTVASMQRIAGASREGLNAKAEQLVRFILENRVTTAEKARSIFQGAEHELQRVLSVKNAPTDAPARAVRYLEALERSASKQGLPGADVAMIRDATKELLNSGLGEDVIVLVPGKGKGAIGGLVPKVSGRAPRTDVSAAEALESARSSSRWQTRKSWGEQAGTRKEAVKAVERAERDAIKAAVPEARELLKREGLAIQTEKVLDRAEFRAANRDVVSLPAHVIGAAEVASGKVPILAVAANWLRNNQLKAGVYADALAKAISKKDTGRVVSILHRLGVGTTAQLLRSAPAGGAP